MAKEPADLEAKEAKHGQRMIEVKLRFWTDEIAEGKGQILPKHAWGSGVARIERNDAHGIKPAAPVPFNSVLEIGTAIEKVLMAHGIKLHSSGRMKKYMKP